MKSRKKKILKLVLSIMILLILIIITVLFLINNPKDKKLIRYTEDLLNINIDKYIASSKGTINPDKYNVRHADIKFEIKSFLINDFKQELDGKMSLYNLNSEVYLENYQEKVKKYVGDMNIDSFYHLLIEDRNIMGILCEDSGNYYFLLIG